MLEPCGEPVTLSDLRGKIIVVDASIVLRRFIEGHARGRRSGGVRDLARHVARSFIELLVALLCNGVKPLLVFDRRFSTYSGGGIQGGSSSSSSSGSNNNGTGTGAVGDALRELLVWRRSSWDAGTGADDRDVRALREFHQLKATCRAARGQLQKQREESQRREKLATLIQSALEAKRGDCCDGASHSDMDGSGSGDDDDDDDVVSVDDLDDEQQREQQHVAAAVEEGWSLQDALLRLFPPTGDSYVASDDMEVCCAEAGMYGTCGLVGDVSWDVVLNKLRLVDAVAQHPAHDSGVDPLPHVQGMHKRAGGDISMDDGGGGGGDTSSSLSMDLGDDDLVCFSGSDVDIGSDSDDDSAGNTLREGHPPAPPTPTSGAVVPIVMGPILHKHPSIPNVTAAVAHAPDMGRPRPDMPFPNAHYSNSSSSSGGGGGGGTQSASDGVERLFSSGVLTLEHAPGSEGSPSDALDRMFLHLHAILELFGVPYLYCSGLEAESVCAALQRSGVADIVATEDSDIFLYGATSVLRGLLAPTKAGPVLYRRERVAEVAGLCVVIFQVGTDGNLSHLYARIDCWDESTDGAACASMMVREGANDGGDDPFVVCGDVLAFACLTGCDFCDGVTGVGPKVAMDLIRSTRFLLVNELVSDQEPGDTTTMCKYFDCLRSTLRSCRYVRPRSLWQSPRGWPQDQSAPVAATPAASTPGHIPSTGECLPTASFPDANAVRAVLYPHWLWARTHSAPSEKPVCSNTTEMHFLFQIKHGAGVRFHWRAPRLYCIEQYLPVYYYDGESGHTASRLLETGVPVLWQPPRSSSLSCHLAAVTAQAPHTHGIGFPLTPTSWCSACGPNRGIREEWKDLLLLRALNRYRSAFPGRDSLVQALVCVHMNAVDVHRPQYPIPEPDPHMELHTVHHHYGAVGWKTTVRVPWECGCEPDSSPAAATAAATRLTLGPPSSSSRC